MLISLNYKIKIQIRQTVRHSTGTKQMLCEYHKNNIYAQIVLMLIYSGVRISELLDSKRKNVHLNEHCFNVVESKTDSGIRIVPIDDKVYPLLKKQYDDGYMSICSTLPTVNILSAEITKIPTGYLS